MNCDTEAGALVSRSVADIEQELGALLAAGSKIVCFLRGGELLFESRLHDIDSAARTIVLCSQSENEANKMLLALPRGIFASSRNGWRIEFVAAGPRLVQQPERSPHEVFIGFNFPEVLSRWRRAHERALTSPGMPLQCVADTEGVMPFEGLVVDIGPGGLGFLIHAETVTLEPGTLLRSCLIEIPGKPACKVDLEVCYSQPIVLGDGTHSVRSGCRFIDRSGSVRELVRFYLGDQRSQN